jgi:hypothetical protein
MKFTNQRKRVYATRKPTMLKIIFVPGRNLIKTPLKVEEKVS